MNATLIRQWLKEPGNHVRAGMWVGAVIVTVLAWLIPYTRQNLAPELTGLAIGVVVIDELARHRDWLQYKRDILKQIGSRVNDAALEAVRLADDEGWLKDGSLKGANLRKANLQDAYMREANLEGADLREANFQGAKLHMTNLEGADLRKANLQDIELHGTNLQGAKLQQANLERADLRMAKNLEGADLGFASCNDDTRWPEDFNPRTFNVMVKK